MGRIKKKYLRNLETNSPDSRIEYTAKRAEAKREIMKIRRQSETL